MLVGTSCSGEPNASSAVLKKILLEGELWGDAAGSYRDRALEATIEVEHLKKILVERWGRRQQEAIKVQRFKKL